MGSGNGLNDPQWFGDANRNPTASAPSDRGSSGDHEDERWMNLALQLAARGQGFVEPNPMVGCVLVRDGACIGQGYHQAFGGPHAEVNALRSLPSGVDATGATAYVTLEPCCHHGKTPPCSLALTAAKVRRVVVAMRDPFPQVDGGGIRQLVDAGIDVTLDVLHSQAERLVAPYLKRIRTGLPWVIAKWAMTADGRIATVSGQSQWISGAESRRHVHRLRGRVDAIIVGAGTVIADDPMLDCRLAEGDRNGDVPARVAKRVVLCRKRFPAIESKLIQTAKSIPTWLFSAPGVDPEQRKRLLDCGAVGFDLASTDGHQMVCQMLEQLGACGMTNVMVEGGSQLLGSFLEPTRGRCLIDECHVYVGAKLFGGAASPGPIAGPGVPRIDRAPHLELERVDQFGQDIRMIYRLNSR